MTSFALASGKRPAMRAGGGPGRILQRKCSACGSHSPAGESCAACQGAARPLQRRSTSPEGGTAHEAPPIVHEVLSSSGAPLGDAERASFEPRFNHDFSGVRVHATGKILPSAMARDDFGGGGQAVPALPGQSAIIGSTTTSTESGQAEECAHPVNFKLGPPKDFGKSDITMAITWESNTGRILDLAYCDVREYVTYDAIPNPPFAPIRPLPNPTTAGEYGFKGESDDTHYWNVDTEIARPRVAGTMVSKQVYQLKCRDCYKDWTNFPNHSYTITREVFSNGGNPELWKYCITKAGVDNSFYYSRQVDIPK